MNCGGLKVFQRSGGWSDVGRFGIGCKLFGFAISKVKRQMRMSKQGYPRIRFCKVPPCLYLQYICYITLFHLHDVRREPTDFSCTSLSWILDVPKSNFIQKYLRWGPQIAWVGRVLQHQTSRFPSLRAPPWPTHPRPHQWCNTSGANDVDTHTVQPREECWNYGGQSHFRARWRSNSEVCGNIIFPEQSKTTKKKHPSPLLLLISLWAVLERFFAAHFSTILPPPKMSLA